MLWSAVLVLLLLLLLVIHSVSLCFCSPAAASGVAHLLEGLPAMRSIPQSDLQSNPKCTKLPFTLILAKFCIIILHSLSYLGKPT